MRTRTLVAALAMLGVLFTYMFWPEDAITHPPGILVKQEPEQSMVLGARPFEKNGYTIAPLAQFKLKARVLHTEHYRFDREADLSPVDLALGWGPMSDQSVLDQMEIDQGGRWYHWRSKRLPIPTDQVVTHSANMHMIPANDEVKEQLSEVRKGHIVELAGYLVEAKAKDGWTWRSSLRRDDTGGGSCELVWVERIAVHE